MGMIHKGGNAVPFHGDHHPVSIYVGDQPIFEPIDQAQDGKTLTFENTYNDAAEVTVFGESTQETLSGKNLLHIEKFNANGQITFTDKGVTSTVNSDGSVTFNGTASANADFYFGIVSLNSGRDAIMSVKHVGGTFGGTKSSFFAYASGFTHVVVCDLVLDGTSSHKMYPNKEYTYFEIYARAGAVFNDATFVFQMELGSTATDYEPYCGGIPAPNPEYPQPIESVKSVELVSSNADGNKSATRTIDLQGRELRSLPDGTHDELVVHRDGTVELVQRCDASMFDPSYPVSSGWKLDTPQTIKLPSIDPLPTYHPYTFVDGNGADIYARVRVFPEPTSMIEDGGN